MGYRVNKSAIRLALLGTASAAVTACNPPVNCGATGVSNGVQNIVCAAGPTTVATGTTDDPATATVTAGEGLNVTSSADQTTVLDITGVFSTFAADAIVLTSAGELDFTSTGDISTTGISNDGVVLSANGGDLLASIGGSITILGDATGLQFSSSGDAEISVVNVTAFSGSGISGSSGGSLVLDAGNIASGRTGVDVTSAGNAAVSTGTVQTSFVGGTGIRVSSGGAVTVTAGPVTTAGANAPGVELTGTNVTATLADISASGAGSRALTVAGNGVVDLTAGNVSTGAAGDDVVLVTNGSTTGATSVGVGTVTSSGVDADGIVVFGSGGPVTISSGAITTSGDASSGVVAQAGDGRLTVTTGAITTTGATNSDGVQMSSNGPITLTANGAISTAGTNSNGIDINGIAGAVVANFGNVTTTGATGSEAVEITATGAITVNQAAGTTASSSSAGIRAVVLHGNGVSGILRDITATGAGSVGLEVASTGPVNLTVGNVASTNDGISIFAPAGNITLVAGDVTTTEASADAVVLTGAEVTGTLRDVTASGADSNGVLVDSTGSVDLTVGSVNAAATGVSITAGGSASVVVGAGATVSGGTQGVVLDGAAGNALTVNGTLRSSTAGNAAYAVSGGPLTLTLGAAGSIVGPLAFTGGDDVLNNGGVMQPSSSTDFGLGADLFNNLATGTVRVIGGAAAFTGLETFNNAGLIDLVDGAANDSLTLSGDYVGSGGRLGVDLVGTASGLSADQLIVAGNISGTTTILPDIVNPVVDTDGVVIVNGGGTLAPGSFTLGITNSGLLGYALVTDGNDLLLVTSADAAIGDAVLLNRVGQEMWYQSFDAISQVMASRRLDYGVERKNPLGFWAQLYGGTDKSGDRSREFSAFGADLSASDRLETHRRGAQVGIDFVSTNFAVGATTGYERAKTDSELGSDIKAEGTNYGAYAQFGMQNGLYGSILAKRDNYDVRISNRGLGLGFVKPDGRSTGIDGELGFRFGGVETVAFSAFAGLSRVNTRLDDYEFGNIQFDDDSFKSLRGRVGARAGFAGKLAPFVEAKLFREFKGDNDVTVTSGSLVDTLEGEGRGTWVRLEGGIGGGQGGGPLITGWADLGDVKGFGLRGGFRF